MSDASAPNPALEGLPTVGQLIDGKYRIERVLGVGGMGAVFAARNELTGKQVALKWMLASMAQSGQAVARFLREAQAAGRISHPNVVDVYDVGRHENSPYLVMEFLHGESLSARLARGPLPVLEAVDVLIPVMRGVAAAHAHGVVHRDLKPDNIFLCRSPKGAPLPPKVVDFGISKLLDDGGNDLHLTQTGAVIGTPYFLAPEQVQAKGAGPAVDVHALGVILYLLLSGRLPYEATNYGALMVAIAIEPHPPLRSHCPNLDPALVAVIDRALAKVPSERWASVDDFARALEPFGTLRFDEGPDAAGPGARASAPSSAGAFAPTQSAAATPAPASAPSAAPTPFATTFHGTAAIPGARSSRSALLGLTAVVALAGLGGAAVAFGTGGAAAPASGGAHVAAAAPAGEAPAGEAEPAPSDAPASATADLAAPAPADPPALTEGLAALAAGDLEAAYRAFEMLPPGSPARARPEVAEVRALHVAARRAEADRLRAHDPAAARAIELELLALPDLAPAVRAELARSLAEAPAAAHGTAEHGLPRPSVPAAPSADSDADDDEPESPPAVPTSGRRPPRSLAPR